MLYSARCFRKNVLHVAHEQLDTPMQLTLGQAAQHAHVSKPYLSQLIPTSKITAERQPNGEFRIDPSELDRISAIRSQGRSENSVRERSDILEKMA